MLTTFNQTAIASYKLMSTVNLPSIHHFLSLLPFMPLDSEYNVKHIFSYFCFMVCFVCLFSFPFWSSYSCNQCGRRRGRPLDVLPPDAGSVCAG